MPSSKTSDNLHAITESGVRRANKGKAVSAAFLAWMLLAIMSYLAYSTATPLRHWQEWACFGFSETGSSVMAWMLYSILRDL